MDALFPFVALLAEGVDRNSVRVSSNSTSIVALLAEGVDRNFGVNLGVLEHAVSPSSRRAWIEIARPPRPASPRPVALLAEGVDRNKLLCDDGPVAK